MAAIFFHKQCMSSLIFHFQGDAPVFRRPEYRHAGGAKAVPAFPGRSRGWSARSGTRACHRQTLKQTFHARGHGPPRVPAVERYDISRVIVVRVLKIFDNDRMDMHYAIISWAVFIHIPKTNNSYDELLRIKSGFPMLKPTTFYSETNLVLVCWRLLQARSGQ